MDRLTKIDKYGEVVASDELATHAYQTCPTGDAIPYMHYCALERLAKYEDTGLTPGQVAELAERYNCDGCLHREGNSWKYKTYPCSECRRRTKDHFTRAEAESALSAQNGGDGA